MPETNVNFANILILGSARNNNEGAGEQPGARLEVTLVHAELTAGVEQVVFNNSGTLIQLKR